MAYHTTIFRQMLQLIPRLEFQSIVNCYNGDYRIRKLTCWTQFVHLIFSQISSRFSIRDIVQNTLFQRNKLYHLGASTVCRSTLADANNKRPFQIYQDTFLRLYQRLNGLAPKYKLRLPTKLFIIDSTTIDLCLTLFPWARFRKTKGAIKLHTSLDADGNLPSFFYMTDGKVHDSKITPKFQIPKGSYLVFDRAYHDFNHYKSYQDNEIRFVTRMKTNAAYQVTETREIEKYTCVISDETIVFTGYQTHKKYPYPLRKIRFWDKENQKILVFLTNDFELSAKTIADIYKARWEIELFFKTIKQNLKIKSFLGTSKNAVLTQIWIAMIIYLILSYLKFQFKSHFSIRSLIHLIQVNLFEGKSLKELILYGGAGPPLPIFSKQQTLFSS